LSLHNSLSAISRIEQTMLASSVAHKPNVQWAFH
jgi:hypothetical protein